MRRSQRVNRLKGIKDRINKHMKILYVPSALSQQRQLEKKIEIYPVKMAMEATYYRDQGHKVVWRTGYNPNIYDRRCDDREFDKVIYKAENLPFLDLPIPDRELTQAMHPRYQKNGNFKHKPGTYILSTSGCWYGKCVFCIETEIEYNIRPVDDLLVEIALCQKMGFKEAFDDSGTFPIGAWLKEFCEKRIKLEEDGFKQIPISCNMRIGTSLDYKMLKRAGFRMLLYGIESANQSTLDKINKRTNTNDVIKNIKEASDAGLEPHITTMFGCPGEGKEEELKTLKLVHYLLKKGYAKTAQASIYRVEGQDYVDTGLGKKIYQVAIYPEFWYNKIKDLKSWADVKYLFRCIKEGLTRWDRAY